MSKNKEVEFQNSYLEVKRVFLEIAKSCKTKDATYLKELNISYHISELTDAFNNPVNINQKNYDLIIDLYGFLKPLWYELMDAFQDIKDKDYDLLIDPIVLELRSCRDYFYGIYDTFSEDFEEQSTLIKSISELSVDSIESQETKTTMAKEKSNNQEETTPEEKLQNLFRIYEGNHNLYHKIKEFTERNSDIGEYEMNEDIRIDGKTIDNFLNGFILNVIEEFVFDTLEAIHIFTDQPFKCFTWIKGRLKDYDIIEAEFLKSRLLDELKDTNRFMPSSDLNFIIESLSNYDCKNLGSEENLTCERYEYFIGNKSFLPNDNWEKVFDAYASVRGYPKITKEQILAQKKREYELAKIEVEEAIELKVNESNRTRDTISEQFDLLDNTKGWEYAFKTQNDYTLFTNLLVNLFEGNNYDLPK